MKGRQKVSELITQRFFALTEAWNLYVEAETAESIAALRTATLLFLSALPLSDDTQPISVLSTRSTPHEFISLVEAFTIRGVELYKEGILSEERLKAGLKRLLLLDTQGRYWGFTNSTHKWRVATDGIWEDPKDLNVRDFEPSPNCVSPFLFSWNEDTT